MHKKWISLDSIEKSLSQIADKVRRRTLLRFERIQVSKSFKQRRGKFHGFVEIFYNSQDRNYIAREPFCVSEKFLVEKLFLWIRGGGYHDFPSKFLSHCTKKHHWRNFWCFR